MVFLFLYLPHYPTPNIPKQRLKTRCRTYKWLHLVNVTLKARLSFFTGDSCTPTVALASPVSTGAQQGWGLSLLSIPSQRGKLAFIHTQLLGINYVRRV